MNADRHRDLNLRHGTHLPRVHRRLLLRDAHFYHFSLSLIHLFFINLCIFIAFTLFILLSTSITETVSSQIFILRFIVNLLLPLINQPTAPSKICRTREDGHPLLLGDQPFAKGSTKRGTMKMCGPVCTLKNDI